MPCKVQIKQNLTDKISADTDSGYNKSLEGAQAIAKEVNQQYGVPVVRFTLDGDFINRDINIPDSLVNRYYEHELALEQQDNTLGEQLTFFQKTTDTVKPGVDDIFNSNPELAKIGTPQQYSAYLDGIFPNSQIKGVVYHGTQEGLIPTDNFKGYVTYFSDSKQYSETFGVPINRKLVTSIVDVKAPYVATSEIANVPEEVHNTGEFINPAFVKSNTTGFDSVVGTDVGQTEGTTIVVFEPEQIHILGNKKDIESFKDFVASNQTTASPKLIKLMKEFIKSIGVDYKLVSDIVVNGEKVDANGVALIMQKLIQVVEGKEDVALPEEAMHFAVEIIKQTNPKLYQTLLKEINNHPKLNEVIALYGNDPQYQKDGRRDIAKLKEEAIAQVLADRLEDIVGRSWFEQIVDWLKSLFYTKSGFDQASFDVLSGKIASVEDIDVSEGSAYFQLQEGEKVFNNLLEESNRIQVVPNGVDEQGKPKSTYELDGIKALQRVSDFAKAFYERIFPQIGKSEFEQALFDLKA